MGNERPRLLWSSGAEVVRDGDDAVVAPLALCDLEDGGPDPVLIEPDGTSRTATLARVPAAQHGPRLRALIIPDRAALARYGLARRWPDPVLELALAAVDGTLAREAVDAVLANLARAVLATR